MSEERLMNAPAINIGAGSTVLAKLSVDELRAELAATLELTARHLVHLADVWRELERRGEDLSNLRSGLWRYMPLIANGTLRAELVVRYAGNSVLLSRLARLSDADQDRLLAQGTVDLVTVRDGEFEERQASLSDLNVSDINLVFRNGLVSPDRQRAYLSSTAAGSQPADKPLSKLEVAIGRYRVRRRGRTAHQVSLSLTDLEWEALNFQARARGVSVASVTAGALAHCGLLKRTDLDGD